jgi:hypothetical protein
VVYLLGELTLGPYITQRDYVLEVGVGETTILTGVILIAENSVNPRLFVGDLFRIPLVDNPMDVVYTSHSLVSNGGEEEIAIKELFRIARKTVVLVAPCYY